MSSGAPHTRSENADRARPVQTQVFDQFRQRYDRSAAAQPSEWPGLQPMTLDTLRVGHDVLGLADDTPPRKG